jgi:beta-carotene hydroxylase
MKHHAYTNNPEKDPDYLNAHSGSLLRVIKRSADGSSTADYGKYLDVFEDDKAFVNSFQKAMPVALLYRACLLSLVVIFPLETFLLWWLPAKIGTVYVVVFFSYYPHIGTSTGRYKDTRFWSHWMPRYINHSMQLHFVHHLHPSIGHFDEPKAIETMKPFLVARGVPGAEEIPDTITYNPLIKFS